MYGAFTSNVDMRSWAPAFGTPENTKANIIAGQLARRYRLPYRTSNANASNAVDLQAAYETEMATWGAVLGGANLIDHAAGWLEGGLTASYEKLVLDVEILQNMMEFLRPIPFEEDDLGFEAIKAVPAGGQALSTPCRVMRRHFISPCFRIGRTTAVGRRREGATHSSAPPKSGSRRCATTSSRRWTQPSEKSWTPILCTAARKSAPESHSVG